MKLSKKLEDAIDQWLVSQRVDLDELIENTNALIGFLYRAELISFKVTFNRTEDNRPYFQVYLPLAPLYNTPASFIIREGYESDGIFDFDEVQELVQSILRLERRAVLAIDTYNLPPIGGRHYP